MEKNEDGEERNMFNLSELFTPDLHFSRWSETASLHLPSLCQIAQDVTTVPLLLTITLSAALRHYHLSPCALVCVYVSKAGQV